MDHKKDTNKRVVRLSRAGIKQKRRSVEERRRIVEETFLPGISVAAVSRRHAINANQIFAWRKLYMAGKLGGGTAITTEPGFISVEVVDEDASRRDAERNHAPASAGGFSWMAEVELPNGIKVRFVTDIDELAMRRVLSVAREPA